MERNNFIKREYMSTRLIYTSFQKSGKKLIFYCEIRKSYRSKVQVDIAQSTYPGVNPKGQMIRSGSMMVLVVKALFNQLKLSFNLIATQ